MELLGKPGELPVHFRDLTTETKMLGGEARLRELGIHVPRLPGRRDPQPAVLGKRGIGEALLGELASEDLLDLYVLTELPYLQRTWEMANLGPLVNPEFLRTYACDKWGAAARMLKARDLPSGRIKAPYYLASTGRVYARSEFLQNLPRVLRGAVVAPPGKALVEVDYHLMDFVSLAALSGDQALHKALREGRDLHMASATIFPTKGTPDRYLGKQLNFTIMFGGGAHKLAELVGISEEEAASGIDAFWETYPDARRWRDDVYARVKTAPARLVNPFGRKAWFGSDDDHRARERRGAAFLCQSTSADVFRKALLCLHDELPPSARVVLQVHDSVLLEVDEGEVELVAQLAEQILTSPIEPVGGLLSVKATSGPSWGSQEPVSAG